MSSQAHLFFVDTAAPCRMRRATNLEDAAVSLCVKMTRPIVVVIAAALLVLEGRVLFRLFFCVRYVEWTSLFSCRDAPVAVVSVRLLLVLLVLDRTLDVNNRIREHLLGFVCTCMQGST